MKMILISFLALLGITNSPALFVKPKNEGRVVEVVKRK